MPITEDVGRPERARLCCRAPVGDDCLPSCSRPEDSWRGRVGERRYDLNLWIGDSFGGAIVDDIGAIIVIAVVYGGTLDLTALAVAIGFLAAAAVLVRVRIDWPPLYLELGVAAWYATYRSGEHATIAASRSVS